MRSKSRPIFVFVLAALAFAPFGESRRHRLPSKKSPHEEITATARVSTDAHRTTHANSRDFEEFDIVILGVHADPEPGDSDVDVQRTSSVHVVHDLTCGGAWVPLSAGDLVELKGEYVQVGRGRDLVHFTHPASGDCGNGEKHADGWLRKKAEAQ